MNGAYTMKVTPIDEMHEVGYTRCMSRSMLIDWRWQWRWKGQRTIQPWKEQSPFPHSLSRIQDPFSQNATAYNSTGGPDPSILDKYQEDKHAYVPLSGITRQRVQMMLSAKVCCWLVSRFPHSRFLIPDFSRKTPLTVRRAQEGGGSQCVTCS